MTLQGNKEPVMATIWFVFLGFWRLLTTRLAWQCFPRAVKSARASNLAHCPENPGRVGLRGLAALCWVVTSFWKEDNSVYLVAKFQGTYEGDWYWGWIGSQSGIDRVNNVLEPLTPVDYYTGVHTPVGVIPLPWVGDWFSHTTDKNIWHTPDDPNPAPRRRSPRSQFKN